MSSRTLSGAMMFEPLFTDLVRVLSQVVIIQVLHNGYSGIPHEVLQRVPSKDFQHCYDTAAMVMVLHYEIKSVSF